MQSTTSFIILGSVPCKDEERESLIAAKTLQVSYCFIRSITHFTSQTKKARKTNWWAEKFLQRYKEVQNAVRHSEEKVLSPGSRITYMYSWKGFDHTAKRSQMISIEIFSFFCCVIYYDCNDWLNLKLICIHKCRKLNRLTMDSRFVPLSYRKITSSEKKINI